MRTKVQQLLIKQTLITCIGWNTSVRQFTSIFILSSRTWYMIIWTIYWACSWTFTSIIAKGFCHACISNWTTSGRISSRTCCLVRCTYSGAKCWTISSCMQNIEWKVLSLWNLYKYMQGYILGWVTGAFSMDARLILWRFPNIDCHKKFLPLNRLGIQQFLLSTSLWRNGSMSGWHSCGSGFKSTWDQFLFAFLQKVVTKWIKLSKMIFHYFNNEFVIFPFAKKSHWS